MPGPAPKKDARRRNARPDTIALPSSGRDGVIPQFPLSHSTPDELAIWDQLWRTPQAVAWERFGYTRAVARYARCLAESEMHGAPSTLLGEVRQMEDRLGLTPMSLLRLRWEITGDELAAAREERQATSSATPAPAARPDRRRLMAVDTASG